MRGKKQELVSKLMQTRAEITSLPNEDIDEFTNAPLSSHKMDYKEEDISIEGLTKWGRDLFQRILEARKKYNSFDEIFKNWARDYSQRKLKKFLPDKEAEVLGEVIGKKLRDYFLLSIPYRKNKSLDPENVGYLHIYMFEDNKVLKRNVRGLSKYLLSKNLDYEVNKRSESYLFQNKMKDDVFGGEIKVPKELEQISTMRQLAWLFNSVGYYYGQYQKNKYVNLDEALEYLKKAFQLVESPKRGID